MQTIEIVDPAIAAIRSNETFSLFESKVQFETDDDDVAITAITKVEQSGYKVSIDVHVIGFDYKDRGGDDHCMWLQYDRIRLSNLWERVGMNERAGMNAWTPAMVIFAAAVIAHHKQRRLRNVPDKLTPYIPEARWIYQEWEDRLHAQEVEQVNLAYTEKINQAQAERDKSLAALTLLHDQCKNGNFISTTS